MPEISVIIIWIIHTVCHFEGVFTTEKSKIPHFVRNDRSEGFGMTDCCFCHRRYE